MNRLRETVPYRILRRHLSTSPRIYRFFGQLLGNKRLVTNDTDLVIDGFPRSANSYVEAAFFVSQRRQGISIMSHTHAAAQIIEATHRELPTVLLYRDPDDAIASFMLMSPDGPGARQLFREYVTFYSAVLPVLDRVVLAPFSLATRDFPAIVERTNELFGKAFVVPVMDETFQAEVAEWRDEASLARSGRVTLYSEAHNPKTLVARKERLAQIRANVAELQDPARLRAHDLFEIIERADRDPKG